MTVEPSYPTDYDGELEVTPVEKHNWKSGASRDRWRGSLDACKEAYPLVEILAVSSDKVGRDVAAIDRGRLRDPEVINMISEEDLQTVVNHDQAYICRDEADGERAVEAADEGNHGKLSQLFGYPDCCIDAFLEIEQKNEVPIYEIACRSENAVEHPDDQTVLLEEPSALLNIIWKYLGYKFISHTPCSFDCEESLEIAQVHGSFYRELGLGDEAEDLWEFLGTPVTWSGFHGLSNIRNGYLIGSTNTPEYWDEKIVVWQEEHADKLL